LLAKKYKRLVYYIYASGAKALEYNAPENLGTS